MDPTVSCQINYAWALVRVTFKSLSINLAYTKYLGKLKVERELLDRVKSLKLGFYGHTTRKYESLEKEMVQGCAPGYRTRGRQRRRWTDDITEWTGMKINEAAAAAEDRDRWRGILRAANPSYGGWH